MKPAPDDRHDERADRDLEDFVRRHRGAFDAEPPSDRVWARLAGELDRSGGPAAGGGGGVPPLSTPEVPFGAPRTGGLRARRGSAVARMLATRGRQIATATMLLTIGVLGGLLVAERGASERAREDALAAQVAEVEQRYRRELDRRMQLVADYRPEPRLTRELERMARPEFSSQAELASVPPGSERAVLEAMAQEYQAKLDALEHVLEQLREAEQAGARPLNQPGPARVAEPL